ncbi:hypothetical protein PIB30_113931, partial [Stylosanthes scabra]|nr:hypothetical protein [Stylosanthes scabra]
MTLRGCRNCYMLPSLGQLPSLKHLEISDFERLEIIGAEFYRDDESCLETPFPMLEVLSFWSMPCWKEWHSLELNSFPRLRELAIGNCHMLRGDLPNHLPSLQSLEIHNCEQLSSCLARAPAVTTFGKLEFQMDGQHHSLQELSITESCDSVTSFSLLDAFP